MECFAGVGCNILKNHIQKYVWVLGKQHAHQDINVNVLSNKKRSASHSEITNVNESTNKLTHSSNHSEHSNRVY